MSQAVALAVADAPPPSRLAAVRLTARQQRFADNWLAEPNGSKAARDAGYKAPAEEAWHLLRRPHVIAYINARIRETAGTGVPRLRHDILERYYAIATADIRDLLTVGRAEGGGPRVQVKESADWTDAIAQCVAEVSGVDEDVIRVRLHDKMEALDRLARITGLLHREPSGFGRYTPAGGSGPPVTVAEIAVRYVAADYSGPDLDWQPLDAHLAGHTSTETTGRGAPLSDRQPKPGGCPGK